MYVILNGSSVYYWHHILIYYKYNWYFLFLSFLSLVFNIKLFSTIMCTSKVFVNISHLKKFTLTHYIMTPTFPSLDSSLCPSTTSPLPYTSYSSACLHKKAGLPGISTEHDIRSYKKSEHKPSYQDRTRLFSRRKHVPQAGKRFTEQSQLSFLGVPQEHPGT